MSCAAAISAPLSFALCLLPSLIPPFLLAVILLLHCPCGLGARHCYS